MVEGSWGGNGVTKRMSVRRRSREEVDRLVVEGDEVKGSRGWVMERVGGWADRNLFPEGGTWFDKRQKLLTIFMVGLTTFFMYADQNLLAPNLTAAARDFGLDDAERDWMLGGILSTLSFSLGAPVSLIAGMMSDTSRRITLLTVVTLIENISCALTIVVTNYPGLLVTRVISGMALGGSLPIAFSLIGDLFPSSIRTYVTGAFGAIQGIGQGAGQFVSGVVGPKLGWKVPFPLIGVPAVISGILMYMFAPEPPRGKIDGREQKADEFSLAKTVEALKIPSNILIFMQAGFGCLPWGVVTAFLNDYLAQDAGLGVFSSSVVFATFGIGSAVGGIFGSVLGQRFQNGKRYKIGLMSGLTTLAAVPPMCFMISLHADSVPLWWFHMAAFWGGFMLSPTGTNVAAQTVNVNSPLTRGSMFAVFNLFNDVGRGLGPFMGALLIHSFGRRIALTASMLFWVPCALGNLCLAYTYPRDEDRYLNSILVSNEDQLTQLEDG